MKTTWQTAHLVGNLGFLLDKHALFTIFRAFEEADLPKPEFDVERGIFKVRLRNGMEMSEDEIDKTDIHQAVIQFCATPRSREELTAFTGKSRYYTMSAIVQPLIDQGRLSMTMPEKPKSPKQRFCSVKRNA